MNVCVCMCVWIDINKQFNHNPIFNTFITKPFPTCNSIQICKHMYRYVCIYVYINIKSECIYVYINNKSISKYIIKTIEP